MKRATTKALPDALPLDEQFFTKPEMAKLMKVSIRCLSDMMRRGEVSFLKINGRLVRFRLLDVNKRLGETVLVNNAPTEKEGA